MSELAVRDFWNAFRCVEEKVAAALDRDDAPEVENALVPLMRRFEGDLGWEVGPGECMPYFFAFALNGDLRNADLARRLVEAAPASDRWSFLVGRPKRSVESMPFVFKNPRGQKVEIVVRDWRYTLTAFQDGEFFDVSVYAPDLPKMDSVAQIQVLRTVLQAGLGELFALTYTDRCEFENLPTVDWLQRSTPIRFLAEHLASLVDRR